MVVYGLLKEMVQYVQLSTILWLGYLTAVKFSFIEQKTNSAG